MGLQGNFVRTFAEASHALPDGMHMNADYPFMLPPIVRLEGREVILKGREGEGRFKIVRDKRGQETCTIEQSSTFEKLFNRNPSRFKAYPFKDRDTEIPEIKP